MISNNLKRSDIERREQETLAPHAALSSKSRGRSYPLEEHPLRTAFQRDRDRIVHSSAFRRMEYKTQVFIPHEKDHYRTRLTHTIEVAQISRTLARILRLNEDLAEAIALVHDLGHTPFGHSGEDVLDLLLNDFGGFNHNRQSLRVVDILEQRYDEHPGLNLTYEVREGIVKHETKIEISEAGFDLNEKPTLEATLVDIADEITYNAHDIDDGLASGIIKADDLRKLPFWDRLGLSKIISKLSKDDDKNRYALSRGLLDIMVTDAAQQTQCNIKKYNIKSVDDIRNSGVSLCAYSDEIAEIVKVLKNFLNINLYKNPQMVTMGEWAKEIIETIYKKLMEDPSLMPPRFQEMLLTEQKELVITDYIAGMTDRFAVKMYEKLE